MSAPRVAAGPDRYDRIGRGYGSRRREDPRWRDAIHAALGEPSRVVNVGAGTGNYEPKDCEVVGLEPSAAMLAQRPGHAAPVVRGVAESLPFPDGAFDVALAVLTAHHWTDHDGGMRELARVARRQVVVTWDPDVSRRFWLYRDYLPELVGFEGGLPSLAHAVAALGASDVRPLLVPRDCVDGFMGAHWARPEMHLDPGVIASMSGLALLERGVVRRALDSLAADLADGTWAARNEELGSLDEFDAGYRLVVAGGA